MDNQPPVDMKPQNRFDEIDFAKGVLIYLMVICHMHYVGSLPSTMANVTTGVYAFHMPAFLVLSGFLCNFERDTKKQVMQLFRGAFIPYLIFEFIYITLIYSAGRMGFKFSNSIDNYNLYSISKYLLLNPIGAYWYLHTFFIGLLTAFLIYKCFKNKMTVLVVTGILFWIISLLVDGFLFGNAIFIILGMALQFYKVKIQASWTSIIAMAVIFYLTLPELTRFSLAGVSLTILSLSSLFAVFELLPDFGFAAAIKKYLLYIGANTLIVVLIHPIFINLFKLISGYFLIIDHSGISYLLFVGVVTVICCCFCAKLMDSTGISRLLFGKNIYVAYRA